MTNRTAPHRGLIMPTLLVGLLSAQSAVAQQAVVRSYDAPDLEVGQAWLMRSGEQCLAVLPAHVVQETSIPSLLREGSRALRGEATEILDLGSDIAIARMNGGIVDDCGFALGSIRRNPDRALRDTGLGTIRSVNGDGTLARLAVTVIDDDGNDYLRILPTAAGDAIRKGLSGSLLVINDQTVGMLLSVTAKSGVGTVMRTDALLAKVEGHVRGTAALRSKGGSEASPSDNHWPRLTGPKGTSPETMVDQVGAWRVTSWSADPVGSAHLASRLTEAGVDGFWEVRVDRWPVAIELAGPPEVQIVRGLAFIAGSPVDPTLRPSRVQVLASVSSDRVSWRVAGSATLDYDAGSARVEFPPVRARKLRIEIYPPATSTDRVALSRLRVLEAAE
jgi:hypothetical protein